MVLLLTIVYLAEKPDQAKKYAAAFMHSTRGDGYIECSDPELGKAVITWAIGHLVELVKPEEYKEEWKNWDLANLPMVPEQVKYTVSQGKNKQFNAVKKQLQNADTIVWAGDIDREGSLISYLICLLAGVWNKPGKTFKRLWITDLLPQTVRKGMKNLRPIDHSYKQAIEAQSRQIGDWLVGMNGSPLFTLTMQNRGIAGTYAIGRVMTPTLYMIYQRENEILNFKEEIYYEIEADFEHANGSYHGKLIIPEHLKEKWDGRCKSVEQAQAVMSNLIKDLSHAKIAKVTTERKETASPKLHQLSTLQTKMNRTLKASPAATLKAVQSLYDKQLLTYPRTDIPYIGQGRFEIIRDNLEEYAKVIGYQGVLPNTEPSKRYVNDAKVAEHEAITPTEKIATEDDFNDMSALEKAVYMEVTKTTLAMFAPKYQFDETVILTSMPDVLFRTTGKVPVVQGWKSVWGNAAEEEDPKDDNSSDVTLPKVANGDDVVPTLVPAQKKTTPPKRYSEGTLLIAMKTAGKTTDDEESQTILKDVEGIGTEATRANVIEKLKAKDKSGNAFVKVEKNLLYVEPKGKTICKAIATTPLLSSAEMTAQWEKFLKQIGKGESQQAEFLNGIVGFLTNLCNEVPTRINEVDFSAEIKIMAEEKAKSGPQEIGVCPKCSGKVMLYDKIAKCEHDTKEGATCGFHVFTTLAQKKLGKAVMSQIIRDGKTKAVVKGFTSKAGKSFDAFVKLGDDGKLAFEFEQKEKK
jgi:DNA topoisomerase-3